MHVFSSSQASQQFSTGVPVGEPTSEPINSVSVRGAWNLKPHTDGGGGEGGANTRLLCTYDVRSARFVCVSAPPLR